MSKKSLVKKYSVYKALFTAVKGIITMVQVVKENNPQFETIKEAENWILENGEEWELLLIIPLYKVKVLEETNAE